MIHLAPIYPHHSSVLNTAVVRKSEFWFRPSGGILVILIWLWLGFPLLGQRLNIKSYAVQDGLPQEQILSVYRDPDGFLWVGTLSGVGRYNGNDWTVFRNKDGLTRNKITALISDGSGRILAGSEDGGLNFFDGRQFRNFPDDTFLSGCNVTDLLRDSRGRVWVASLAGLALLDGDRVSVLDQPHQKMLKNCTALAESADGSIWVATRQSLIQIDPETQNIRRSIEIVADKEIKVIVEDPFWGFLAATDKGLYVLRDDALHMLTIQGMPFDFHFHCVTRDSEGYLWFGTNGDGAFQLRRDSYRNIGPHNGLPNGIVRTILSDRENILWMGTDNCLSKYLPGPFLAYTKQDGLVNDFARALYLDPEDRLWVGTRDGVSIFDADYQMETYPTDQFASSQIYGITRTEDGRMLFATFGGLVEVKDGVVRNFTKADGLRVAFVRHLLIDSRSRIWVGGEGLFEWTEQGFQYFPEDHVLGRTRVVQSMEGPDGWLWLATADGLIAFHPDTGELKTFEEVKDVIIWCLDIDRDGNVWVGTNGRGVYRYDYKTQEFDHFDSSKGLKNDFVWQVVVAENGDLWVGHTLGIDRVADGKVFHFNKSDGLADNECAATACLQDRRGNLWFGTGRGLTRYDPSLPSFSKTPPYIYIESVLIHDQVALPRDNFEFQRGNNTMGFRFTALHFSKEKETRYSYRLGGLEGPESQWSDPSTETSFKYVDLNPGDYHFEVRALSSDGLWSLEPASLSFTILPAFWETLQFRALLLLVIAGLVLLYVRIRLHRLKRYQEDLERRIAEKTSELESAQEKLVESAHQAGMAEIASGILHNVGNLLNSINISVEVIRGIEDHSKATCFLRRFLKLMNAHEDDLASFFTDTQQGRKVPLTLNKTLNLLEGKQERVVQELNKLSELIFHVNEIVRTQQAYAKVERLFAEVDLNVVIEDAIKIESNVLKNPSIEFVCDLGDLPFMKVPKIKLMQVVINLLKNSVEALNQLPSHFAKRVFVKSYKSADGTVYIEVADNGVGIDEEHKNVIFSYGFTTKMEGHGFGLHFCAIAMAEMAGRIRVLSEGRGKGSTFILEFYENTNNQALSSGELRAAGA